MGYDEGTVRLVVVEWQEVLRMGFRSKPESTTAYMIASESNQGRYLNVYCYSVVMVIFCELTYTAGNVVRFK